MEYITKKEDRENQEYQEKMLEYFELDVFDEKKLTNSIIQLYNKIKRKSRYTEELLSIMKDKASTIFSNDPIIGFMLFFSFDTHEICYNTIQVLLHGNDEEWEESLKKFKEAIQK